MTKTHYYGVIERAADGYGIYFPDFAGCVSGGGTLDDAVAMGTEALQFHIDGMIEDGDPIPDPSEVDLGRERIETPTADLHALVAITVSVPTFPDTIDVPLKSEIVREIAEVVKRNVGAIDEMNRRSFVENAVRRELDRLKKSA